VSDPIARASWAGTVVFALTSGAAVVATPVRGAAAAVALLLFAAGSAAFVLALTRAAARSRTEDVNVPGVFFLQGSAAKGVRRLLLGSAAAQTVVAFATAAARPFTSLAFGILVPVYGLGLAGLWGARHGRFGPRRR
jgi:hypothetical protein